MDGMVTDDSDAFAFGGRTVYKNIFNERKFVEAYLLGDCEKVGTFQGWQAEQGDDDGATVSAFSLGTTLTHGRIWGYRLTRRSHAWRSFPR